MRKRRESFSNCRFPVVLMASVLAVGIHGSALAETAAKSDTGKKAPASAASPSKSSAQSESNAAVSKNAKQAGSNSAAAKAGKPAIKPWKSFKGENERTYNIFKYNLSKERIDASNPDNWRAFDPYLFKERNKLVPDPAEMKGVAPIKYPSTDCLTAMDPAKVAAIDGGYNKIVYAHQGTPLVNGWVAPEAGYAYQMEGVLVYGTTNYTPLNYQGSMSKYIGVNRVPVEILGPGGSKGKLDFSRLVFPVSDDLVARPQSKVYPSLIYLKPGEVAAIQGHGNVNCPKPGQSEQITLATPGGERQIKIVCTPNDAVIPGKVSP